MVVGAVGGEKSLVIRKCDNERKTRKQSSEALQKYNFFCHFLLGKNKSPPQSKYLK